jgi:hypothetical protein
MLRMRMPMPMVRPMRRPAPAPPAAPSHMRAHVVNRHPQRQLHDGGAQRNRYSLR